MVNAWLKEVHVMFDSDAKPLAVFDQLPPIMSNEYHLHKYVHEDEQRCRYHPTTLEIKLEEQRREIRSLESAVENYDTTDAENRAVSQVVAKLHRILDERKPLGGTFGDPELQRLADRVLAAVRLAPCHRPDVGRRIRVLEVEPGCRPEKELRSGDVVIVSTDSRPTPDRVDAVWVQTEPVWIGNDSCRGGWVKRWEYADVEAQPVTREQLLDAVGSAMLDLVREKLRCATPR